MIIQALKKGKKVYIREFPRFKRPILTGKIEEAIDYSAEAVKSVRDDCLDPSHKLSKVTILVN